MEKTLAFPDPGELSNGRYDIAFGGFPTTTECATEAVPKRDPVNHVDVTEESPAIVVADDPKDTAVDPIVTEEFANCEFAMFAVLDKFDVVNPEIEPPRVIVPLVVIVPPVSVIPLTVPEVATEVTVPVFVVYPLGFDAG